MPLRTFRRVFAVQQSCVGTPQYYHTYSPVDLIRTQQGRITLETAHSPAILDLFLLLGLRLMRTFTDGMYDHTWWANVLMTQGTV